MKRFKKGLIFGVSLIMVMSTMACGKTEDKSESSASSGDKVIKVGTSILFEDPLRAAEAEFEELSGYDMEIVVFDDAVATNVALEEGSIDANFYQHEPYLDAFNESKKTNLKMYGQKILASDYGLYSNRIKSIDEIEDGFRMSLPNDASNRAMGLKFLQDQGIIKLKDGVEFPTQLDIVENKKNIEFVEMDRLSLVKSLDEVDICAMPAIYMFQSGEDPTSAIASGYSSDELGIVTVVKEENLDADWAKHIEEALTSESERKFIEEHYKGSVVPLF